MTYFVYVITNHRHSVLYTGVTNNLERRAFEHKNGLMEGFTKKYRCHKIVYFEQTNEINSALEREKQIKNMSRERKEELIRMINPNWLDLLKE